MERLRFDCDDMVHQSQKCCNEQGIGKGRDLGREGFYYG